jgi:hypothetical protein
MAVPDGAQGVVVAAALAFLLQGDHQFLVRDRRQQQREALQVGGGLDPDPMKKVRIVVCWPWVSRNPFCLVL